MTPFSSVAALFEKPQTSKVSMHRTANGGISSVADVQAVFPGSPEQFALAIAHLTHYDLLSYRTIFSADRSPSDAALGYHLQIQAISAGALGIDGTYLFATNNYGELLPNHAFGFKWNLERSYKDTNSQVRAPGILHPSAIKGLSAPMCATSTTRYSASRRRFRS